jgi:ACS family hexuronate transporter-like MFS transporter
MQAPTQRKNGIRWFILALLFLATAINYVDRQTLSILAPTIRAQFHLTEIDYSRVVSAFLLSYTVMYTVSGRIIDKIGVRLGMAASILWWSIATMATALARGGLSLASLRFGLGVGEPGVYPAGLRAVAEWFPERERAMAAGIFSSGSAVGALIAPPLIAFLALRFGWRYAFLLPGAIGLLWLPIWLLVYRTPKAIRAGTLEHGPETLQGGSPSRSWLELIHDRRVLALILPRFASDPVWYFYLFWLPDYLQRNRHFSLAKVGLYGWIPFLFADLGNILGGVASDSLIRLGHPPARSRVFILVAGASLAPLGALVGLVENVPVAFAIICLVAFLSQNWSTNSGALALDVVPVSETSSVIGLMGTAGSLGGILFSQALGLVIEHFGYSAAFIFSSALQPIAALLLVFLLKPYLPSPGRKGAEASV